MKRDPRHRSDTATLRKLAARHVYFHLGRRRDDVLGLLPLALESGETGREIEGPMAIVILGGLLTSTALNLLVLPTLALRFGGFRPRPVPEVD